MSNHVEPRYEVTACCANCGVTFPFRRQSGRQRGAGGCRGCLWRLLPLSSTDIHSLAAMSSAPLCADSANAAFSSGGRPGRSADSQSSRCGLGGAGSGTGAPALGAMQHLRERVLADFRTNEVRACQGFIGSSGSGFDRCRQPLTDLTATSARSQVLEGWSRRPEQATWILSRLTPGHLATSLLVMEVMQMQHVQALNETRTVLC